MSDFTSAISQPTGRRYIAYLHRSSDGFIFDTTENGVGVDKFKGVNLSGLVGANREPYQLDYTESPPNTYSWTLDVTNFTGGDYTYVGREIVTVDNVATEYSNVIEDKFTVVGGSVSTTELRVNISTAAQLTLYVYIKSRISLKYYKNSDKTFADVVLATATEETKSDFRFPFTEDPALSGKYLLVLDTSIIPDGIYELSAINQVGGVEFAAGEPATFYIKDGKETNGVLLNTVSLNADTGGVDNLRYMTAAGVAVSGATISVYLTSDYDAGVFTNVLGSTLTTDDGRWADTIKVPSALPGFYTIHFQKAGKYGPNTETV